ncbi:MAG: hypothetical protein WCR21_12945 [Bacteroidota bacterium]
MKRKFIITAEMRDLEKQVNLAEISYSRMIEILCEKADEYAKPELIVLPFTLLYWLMTGIMLEPLCQQLIETTKDEK